MKNTLFFLALLLSCSLHGQVITTVCGDGTYGFPGNGIPATASKVGYLVSMATDSRGNVYFCDARHHQVHKISPSGIITLIAGADTSFRSTYSGDGGPATSAGLIGPRSVVIDKYGNVYVDEGPVGLIRKIDTNGVISRYAGVGYTGVSSGDGRPATSAIIDGAQAIAIDKNLNLFIVESYRIRKVSSDGIISTFWGVGNLDTCEIMGGSATAAVVGGTKTLAIDTAGNLLIPNNDCETIHKITPTGTVTKFAGVTWAPLGDEGPATAAGLGGNCGIWVDAQNQVYIANCASRIRRIDNNGIIHTIIGGGTGPFSADGTLALGASLDIAAGGGCVGHTIYFISQDYRISRVNFALDVLDVHDSTVKCLAYPNPGNGTLHIQFPFSLTGSAAVKLYTTTGALAYETTVTEQNATIESSLSAGTYEIHIYYRDKHYNGKVVVER